MKYLKQFLIIIAVSFLGEVLHYFIPLPVPASIYGMILLFAGLASGLIPLAAVRETGMFLVEIMLVTILPLMAGLIDTWEIVKDSWLKYLAITFITTFIVMVAVGKVVQLTMKKSAGKEEGDA